MTEIYRISWVSFTETKRKYLFIGYLIIVCLSLLLIFINLGTLGEFLALCTILLGYISYIFIFYKVNQEKIYIETHKEEIEINLKKNRKEIEENKEKNQKEKKISKDFLYFGNPSLDCKKCGYAFTESDKKIFKVNNSIYCPLCGTRCEANFLTPKEFKKKLLIYSWTFTLTQIFIFFLFVIQETKFVFKIFIYLDGIFLALFILYQIYKAKIHQKRTNASNYED